MGQEQGTGVARLTNVGLALAAMKQIQAASAQMPRIAAVVGAPGLGKTQAAAHMAHPAGVNAVFIIAAAVTLVGFLLVVLVIRPKMEAKQA